MYKIFSIFILFLFMGCIKQHKMPVDKKLISFEVIREFSIDEQHPSKMILSQEEFNKYLELVPSVGGRQEPIPIVDFTDQNLFMIVFPNDEATDSQIDEIFKINERYYYTLINQPLDRKFKTFKYNFIRLPKEVTNLNKYQK